MDNLLNTVNFFEKKMTPEELGEYLSTLGFINIAGETIVHDNGTEWIVTTEKGNGVGYNNGYTAVNTENGDVWVAKGTLSREDIIKIVHSFTGLVKDPYPSRDWGNSSVPLGVDGELKNPDLVVKKLEETSE